MDLMILEAFSNLNGSVILWLHFAETVFSLLLVKCCGRWVISIYRSVSTPG